MKSTVCHENKDIGYIIYTDNHVINEKYIHIHHFYVYNEHRNKGYFKLLMNKIEEIAKEMEISKLKLSIGSAEMNEVWLYSLYSKYGFVEQDGLMVKELRRVKC